MSIDRRILQEAVPAAAIFALLLAAYIALKGGSVGAFELTRLLINGLPLVFIALGQYLVIMTREIDLSLGPLVSVTTCLAAFGDAQFSTALVPLVLVAGVLAGLLNGLFVTRWRAPSVIVTLGTMTLLQGIGLLLLPAPSSTVPAWLTGAFAWMSGLPVPVILLAGALVASIAIGSSRYGVLARAVGIDAAAARLNGVDVTRIRITTFVLAALMAAIGGLVLTATTASGSPSIGDPYILTSIAAAVVGGVSLQGGKGSPLGVVLGCYSLTLVGSILYQANVSSYLQSLVEGCVLLLAVAFGLIRWQRSVAGSA